MHPGSGRQFGPGPDQQHQLGRVYPRQFNDIPAATLTVVTNYPSEISFEEQNVSKPNGFANRDSWHFSNNGVSPFLFGNSDAFTITMDVTLTGDPISPRKEAGFVFNNPLNDGGQFIVNTDGHEVVAFGRFLPSMPSRGISIRVTLSRWV
jgi:hypothetical protein